MVGKASIFLWVVGVVLHVIGWSLFFRMAIESNRVLPPNKRIPLIELRYHGVSEIRRRHEDSFPESGLSKTFLVLIVLATLSIGSGIIAELARTSK
jgi:hypothetical protein